MTQDSADKFWAVVIGTGFGGAVTACRLVQALEALGDKRGDKRICVLERGHRYSSSDFPDMPEPKSFVFPDEHRWLWQSDQGLFDARYMDGCGILQAAGYGGGSLIYANVHLRAPDAVFEGWPGNINRAALDDYYDLVAAMLQIQPVSDNSAALPKTQVFEKAARTLEVTAFRPPIAVSFEEGTNGVNEFGGKQGACQNCGACCFGCRHDAKNTLDRNYLAVVDSRPSIAEVRTLCEVVAISELNGGADEKYEILYRDFTRRERLFRTDEERRTCPGPEYARINAKYVFICGGAINTTELLMRSRRAYEIRCSTDDEALPRGLSKLSPRLGQGYFPNADGIAMAFDTKEEIKPSVGPTITTSAVVNRNQQWFLVQDGGYPDKLRHFFDMAFRSGLLLESNRFVTDIDPKGAMGAAFRWPHAEHKNPAHLGRAPNIIDGFAGALAEGDFDAMIPEHFDESLFTWWKYFRTALDSRDEIDQIVRSVKDGLHVWSPFYWLLGITNEKILGLVRRAVDTYFNLRNPGRLIKGGNAMLMDRLSGRLGPVRPGVPTDVSLIPRFEGHGKKDPWEHRLPLLVMGRGDRPFSLDVVHGSHSFFTDLKASVRQPDSPQSALASRTGAKDIDCRLTTAKGARHELLPNMGEKALRAADAREAWHKTYMDEELFFRDLAGAMNSELRTNPLWTLGGVPVSAHSQGGCAMSEGKDGVTDQHGEVRNHPNLFVNDGSLFPSSVGVNPSSTIAALAERNIEHFIQTQKELVLHSWKAPQYTELVRDWKKRAKAGGWTLEPPAVSPSKIIAKPLGIEFNEKMQGFFEWQGSESLPPKRQDADAFFRAEVGGRSQGYTISFDVPARIDSVDTFMMDPTHDICFTGGNLVIKGENTNVEQGTMRLLVELSSDQRRMDYEIVAVTKDKRDRYILNGHKYLRNEPGPAAWADTSILFSTVTKETDGTVVDRGVGVLRLTLDEFLFQAVPSFKVIHSDGDKAREVQTLLRFMQFFVGGLQSVYVPNLTSAPSLFQKRGAS